MEVCEKKMEKMEVWTCFLQSENKIKLTFEKKQGSTKKTSFQVIKIYLQRNKKMILGYLFGRSIPHLIPAIPSNSWNSTFWALPGSWPNRPTWPGIPQTSRVNIAIENPVSKVMHPIFPSPLAVDVWWNPLDMLIVSTARIGIIQNYRKWWDFPWRLCHVCLLDC